MLAKRIIACLDVKDGYVVKGVQFRHHQVVGDILTLAQRYAQQGVDELVFYDITASSDGRTVARDWVRKVAQVIDIPFCVAGGIRTLEEARDILHQGADKISINSPALNRPDLINELVAALGQQCVVIGVDSLECEGDYRVYQYTGDPQKTTISGWRTFDWLQEVQSRGAGEIVLNCMNQDGMRQGYDLLQLQQARAICHIPLIASGGAGTCDHFVQVFQQTKVDGALAASIFHQSVVTIEQLKSYLMQQNIPIRWEQAHVHPE